MLRPGRLGCRLRLKTPSAADRLAILETKTAHMPLDASAKAVLKEFAEATAGKNGADLGGLCQRAAWACMREYIATGKADKPDFDKDPLIITEAHFRDIFAPSPDNPPPPVAKPGCFL